MITKIAISIAEAAAIGASGGMGDYKAHKLTKDQEQLMKHHYELGPNANLKMRNLGRGLAGYFIGEAPGRILGSLLTGRHPVGSSLGGMAGGLLGAHIGTNKYSPKAADALTKKYRTAKV